MCEGAFLQVQDELHALLWECGSGRELREKGCGVDVEHAARLDAYETVPHMRADHFAPFDLTTLTDGSGARQGGRATKEREKAGD